MKAFVQSRVLIIFFVLAVLVALVSMAIRATDPAALGEAIRAMFAANQKADIITGIQYSLETPVLWNAILFPAAPTIAALIVIAIAYGPGGLSRWFARALPWRGVTWQRGAGVWLLAVTAFFAMVGVFFIALASSGGVAEIAPTVERFGATPLLALGGLALALVLSSGPLLEEMGWRGFALPVLLTRFTPILASVILGALWAAWHLPREIGPLMSGADGVWTAFLWKQMNFLPGCIAGSLIATFVYFKLGGSVWGGVLAHAFHNEMSVNVMRVAVPDIMIGAFPLGILTLIEIAIAVGLIILTRGDLGADKDYRNEPHPFAR